MFMGTEIERKYLLDRLPSDIQLNAGEKIHQGYIVADGRSSLRIRSKGSGFYLTVKRGRGLIREEVEIELSQEQFSELWPLTQGWRLEKTRYGHNWKEYLIEIDAFEGPLTGLVMAEVEFLNEADARAFVPPSFFGREVTGDRTFTNMNLALHGLGEGS
jgi:CYTH domain-containing protein